MVSLRDFTFKHALCGSSRYLPSLPYFVFSLASPVVLLSNVLDIFVFAHLVPGLSSLPVCLRGPSGAPGGLPAPQHPGPGALGNLPHPFGFGPGQLAPVASPHTHTAEGKPRPLARYCLRSPELDSSGLECNVLRSQLRTPRVVSGDGPSAGLGTQLLEAALDSSWVRTPEPALPSCMPLSQWLNFSKLQFLHLYNEDNRSYQPQKVVVRIKW